MNKLLLIVLASFVLAGCPAKQNKPRAPVPVVPVVVVGPAPEGMPAPTPMPTLPPEESTPLPEGPGPNVATPTPVPVPSINPVNAVDMTPKGVKLRSTAGVEDERKMWIDEALTKLFDDASKAYGYTQMMKHSDYTVVVRSDCVLSPVQQILSFVLIAPNYNNTIYDIDPDPNVGRIYAAEQVTTVWRNGQSRTIPTITVCNGERQLTLNTVRYGGEHILHDNGNYQLYLQTVGPEHIHPIVTEY